MICRLDLPLGFGESDAFEEFIKIAHNPRFDGVSRRTTTRDFVKYFRQRRSLVLEKLQASFCICLTSDIVFGNAKEDYLSVVAHYVTPDWELEKRVIGLHLNDDKHTGVVISERVSECVSDWGLSSKILSITLDNASSNSKAIEKLQPALSGYVGSVLLHQRCVCHIINLIVKSGLKRLKPYIEAFRTAISFLNGSNQRIAAYKKFCLSVNARPRKFGLDMDVR